jgi:hypothetical protein
VQHYENVITLSKTDAGSTQSFRYWLTPFLVCGELGLRTALTMLTSPYTSAHNGSAECLLVADKALISGWA